MGSDYRSVEDKVSLFKLAKRVGVAEACRQMKFSRGHYYRLLPRYKKNGKAGLQSKSRHRLPRWGFKSAVVETILWITHARPQWTRNQVAHSVWLESGRRWRVSSTGVYGVWRRRGLNTRAQRFAFAKQPAKPRPAALPDRSIASGRVSVDGDTSEV